MKRIRKRTFAGVSLEVIFFHRSDKTRNIKAAKPRMRFKDQSERDHHKTQISRRLHARLFNENFSPSSLYCTLTFGDEYEIHTFDEAKLVRDRYWNYLKRHFPDAVIFMYMGRGKTTNRIHFHMVVNGIPESFIVEKWEYGKVVHIRNLREHNYYNGQDYGQDYTGLANYLFDHWTPEIGGHRWKMTKNVRRPQEEDAKEVKREYTVDKPPKPPKGYMLVEAKANQYGYLYFKYVKIPPKDTERHRKRNFQTGPPPVN